MKSTISRSTTRAKKAALKVLLKQRYPNLSFRPTEIISDGLIVCNNDENNNWHDDLLIKLPNDTILVSAEVVDEVRKTLPLIVEFVIKGVVNFIDDEFCSDFNSFKVDMLPIKYWRDIEWALMSTHGYYSKAIIKKYFQDECSTLYFTLVSCGVYVYRKVSKRKKEILIFYSNDDELYVSSEFERKLRKKFYVRGDFISYQLAKWIHEKIGDDLRKAGFCVFNPFGNERIKNSYLWVEPRYFSYRGGYVKI